MTDRYRFVAGHGPRQTCATIGGTGATEQVIEMTHYSKLIPRAAVTLGALSTTTLRAQQSDADTDVALVLQRSVSDVLSQEIETLDVVVAGRTP